MSNKYWLIFLFLGAAAAGAAPKTTAKPRGDRVTPLVRAVHRVLPAVVNIGTESIVRVSDPFESFFNDFFGRYKYYKQLIPLGSGVIIDPAGLILTNYHVVRRASNLQIRLWNGSQYSAVSIALDETNDLALLRLQVPPGKDKRDVFTAIPFGLPDDLLLGETVAAVGNPFGLEDSVSAGVLSARNRNWEEGNVVFHDILQTDAAINPGNSGGPLVNIDGELIGINIAIRRDAQGIGFAIPLKRIEDVLAHWLVPSRFSLACCGLIPKTEVRNGHSIAVIGALDPHGPAAAAGLKVGERLLRINGIPVSRAIEAGRILWRLRLNDRVTIECAGRKPVRFRLCRLSPNRLLLYRLGIQCQELTPALKRALGLAASVRGLAISDFAQDSDLAQVAQRGDIIFRIGDVPTARLDDALTALKNVRPGQTIPVFLIQFLQQNGTIYARRFAVNVMVH